MEGKEWGIDILTQSGEHLKTITLPSGCEGPHLSKMGHDIYVIDRACRMIHKCTGGNIIASVQMQFTPADFTATSKHLWTWDKDNANIRRISLDSQNNIQMIESDRVRLQDGFTLVDRVAASEERLAVCGFEGHEVHVYDHYGSLLFVYGGEGILGSVRDICLDIFNNLYIADCTNDIVVIVASNGKQMYELRDGMYMPERLHVSNNMLYVLRGWHGEITQYRLTWR